MLYVQEHNIIRGFDGDYWLVDLELCELSTFKWRAPIMSYWVTVAPLITEYIQG